MAKLSDSILTNIFTLQRSLVESIDTTTALEFRIFEHWGETAETLTTALIRDCQLIEIDGEI